MKYGIELNKRYYLNGKYKMSMEEAIELFFDRITHHKLLRAMKKDILQDEKVCFDFLIRKSLKANKLTIRIPKRYKKYVKTLPWFIPPSQKGLLIQGISQYGRLKIILDKDLEMTHLDYLELWDEFKKLEAKANDTPNVL